MTNSAKETIKQTFINLLEENPFDKITVTDIVQRSNINRNTFYYHFQDIYSLLDEILKEEIKKNFKPAENVKDSLETGWVEGFLHSIQFIKEHKRTAYHLYNSECREQLEKFQLEIISTTMHSIIQDIASDLSIEEETLNILSQFYAFALTGIINDWFQRGMNYDLEEYVRKIHKILEGNIRADLERISKTSQNQPNR